MITDLSPPPQYFDYLENIKEKIAVKKEKGSLGN
jgi:hypothetical protein